MRTGAAQSWAEKTWKTQPQRPGHKGFFAEPVGAFSLGRLALPSLLWWDLRSLTQILLGVIEGLEAVCCPPSIPNASGIIPSSRIGNGLPPRDSVLKPTVPGCLQLYPFRSPRSTLRFVPAPLNPRSTRQTVRGSQTCDCAHPQDFKGVHPEVLIVSKRNVKSKIEINDFVLSLKL